MIIKWNFKGDLHWPFQVDLRSIGVKGQIFKLGQFKVIFGNFISFCYVLIFNKENISITENDLDLLSRSKVKWSRIYLVLAKFKASPKSLWRHACAICSITYVETLSEYSSPLVTFFCIQGQGHYVLSNSSKESHILDFECKYLRN